jgi:RNA polymerase sigma factor (sigma-70 family)
MKQEEFEYIFKNHYKKTASYAHKLVNDKNIAEKIACESFIKLWDCRDELINEKTIRSHLISHVKQAVIIHLGNSKQDIIHRQEYLDTVTTSVDIGDHLNNEYYIQELNATINKLPTRLKKVLNLSLQGLNNAQIADRLGISNDTVSTLKSQAYKFLKKVLINNSTERFNDTNSTISNIQHISIIKDEINTELIKYLARHPHMMHDINAYKFEALVAELMKDMGYDVYLTPKTRDGGRDIIAVMNMPPNEKIVTIVQCKRNSADNIVGIDIVERFIYTIRDKDKANIGWIVTTSAFSKDAINKQKEYKWLLKLKDNENLTAWCSNYGRWTKSSSGGLWLPNNPLG